MNASYILQLGMTYDSHEKPENEDRYVETVVDLDYRFIFGENGKLLIKEDYFERNPEKGILIKRTEEIAALSYYDSVKLRDFLNYALSQTSGANAQG